MADTSVVVEADNGKKLKFFERTASAPSGKNIYQWRLEPQDSTLRGIIFLVHGYSVYSRRLETFAQLLCSELDCVVVSHDHMGHGKSDGERVMVDDFYVFVEDIFAHLNEVKQHYPDVPIYLFGESMGGTLSILAACKRPDFFKAVVLSSPAIIIDPDTVPGKVKECFGRIINRFFPRMEILPPIDPNVISSDPAEVEAFRNDPLSWHKGMKVRFAVAFGEALETVEGLIPTIEWPFLVVHGDEDKLTYVGGSRLLHEKAKSEDKEIKIYEGLRHALLFEVKEKADKVKSDIVEWLRNRIPS